MATFVRAVKDEEGKAGMGSARQGEKGSRQGQRGAVQDKPRMHREGKEVQGRVGQRRARWGKVRKD